MNDFEFDDIIRRKFDSSRFEGAEENFLHLRKALFRRRIIYTTQRTLPYLVILTAGLFLGYWWGNSSVSESHSGNTRIPLSENVSFREQETKSDVRGTTTSGNHYSYFSKSSVVNPSYGFWAGHVLRKKGLTFSSLSYKPKAEYSLYSKGNHSGNEKAYTSPNKFPEYDIPALVKQEASEESPAETFISGSGEKKSDKSTSFAGTEVSLGVKHFSHTDSILVASSDGLKNPFIKYVKVRKNEFYVHVFGGYSMGWKNGETIEGRSFMPEIGLMYERLLPENLSVRTGLWFTMISGLNSCTNTFTVVEMDTRYRKTVWEFKTPALYYLRIPLILAYNDRAGRNAFHAGFLADILMNSRNEINRYSYNTSFQYQVISEVDYGYAMEGFHRVSGVFSLGYRRSVNRHIRLGLDITHHITNVVKNYRFFDNRTFKNSKAPAIYAGLEYKF